MPHFIERYANQAIKTELTEEIATVPPTFYSIDAQIKIAEKTLINREIKCQLLLLKKAGNVTEVGVKQTEQKICDRAKSLLI
jgi:hypothetical protein